MGSQNKLKVGSPLGYLLLTHFRHLLTITYLKCHLLSTFKKYTAKVRGVDKKKRDY